ncbi:MAG: tRNA 2-thiouridine(34) synthase MnmA [Candidatus Uhrbacteria bacterium]|nr:tRNA 2-thiouridine(34) synthase MnmA [Candidatus Uhrbacteria bacterium]
MKQNITKPLKILVGMSGGVDSSVAAALLVKQGFDVTGGFIKNWSDSKDFWTGECAWRGERRDALRVAAQLDIPLLTFDFEKEYRHRVLDRMFAEYQKGLTPNPDVLCNEEIKFGLFFEAAMRQGFDGVATGHYARVRHDGDGQAHLLKGLDPNKDQSYFLHRLSQKVLQKTLFPIGHLHKTRVRQLATQMKLPTAKKPDSQGICFVGKLDFHEFLRKRIKPTPGDIVTPEGLTVGRHDGLDAYTIGQRHGFFVKAPLRAGFHHRQGYGGQVGGQAWYVAKKDFKKNQLIIVPSREHPLLYQKEAVIKDVNWTGGRLRRAGYRLQVTADRLQGIEVAIRYRQKPEKARLVIARSESANDAAISDSDGRLLRRKTPRNDKVSYRLLFDHPVWALAPGQSAVLYRGAECLGGGFIG